MQDLCSQTLQIYTNFRGSVNSFNMLLIAESRTRIAENIFDFGTVGGLMCRALDGCWVVFCLHPLWVLQRFLDDDARTEMVMPRCFLSEPSTPVAL